MTVRVRYKPNDLSEGVVEEIEEANSYVRHEDDSLELRWVWDEGSHRKYRKVGSVRKGTWDSIVIVEDEIDVLDEDDEDAEA